MDGHHYHPNHEHQLLGNAPHNIPIGTKAAGVTASRSHSAGMFQSQSHSMTHPIHLASSSSAASHVSNGTPSHSQSAPPAASATTGPPPPAKETHSHSNGSATATKKSHSKSSVGADSQQGGGGGGGVRGKLILMRGLPGSGKTTLAKCVCILLIFESFSMR